MSDVPLPHPQVLFTEIDDGTGVLLHLDTKFYYTLNATGVAVWKALRDRSGASVPAIAERLAAEFRVGLEQAHADVDALLRELRADGLVLDAPP
jgi:Coenzyme PQQ synthesis protein D (PqqD)